MSKKIRGEYKTFGKIIRVKFEKNKVAIPYSEADAVMLFGYGLDHAWSVYNFLNDETLIETDEVRAYVERFNSRKEFRLKEIAKVQKIWDEVIEEVTPKRSIRHE